MYRVELIEHGDPNGDNAECVVDFRTLAEAEEFVNRVHSGNDGFEWYMEAKAPVVISDQERFIEFGVRHRPLHNGEHHV
jgi:hypothetical protein